MGVASKVIFFGRWLLPLLWGGFKIEMVREDSGI